MLYEVLLADQPVWNIPLIAVLVLITLSYSFLINRYTTIKHYHKQALFFYTCIVLLCLTIASPLATLSHFSFSLHMIQMSIHYFIVPPLLLLGIPYPLYQQMRNVPIIKHLNQLVLSPKIALVIFALLFLFYHFPVAINFFSQNAHFHIGYLLLLFVLAIRMWWPIASPDPVQRLRTVQMKRYAFLSGLLLMPACLLFIFSALMEGMNNPFISQITAHLCTPNQSSNFQLIPPFFNSKFDQIMAGTVMLGMHKFSIMLSFRLGR